MQEFPRIPNTELFLAGGCVRDTLLGLPPKDRDFVAITSLSFSEFVEAVNTIGTVFQERPEFLTIRCRINGESIDIAFPRSEDGYVDNRHPTDVERIEGLTVEEILSQDSARRDFTINSMFMTSTGEILDYHFGREDLASKRIIAVGVPKERFREDALRILRGIRFSCKLGFEIGFSTQAAMLAMAPLLGNISVERIREEINGALKANPAKAFEFFRVFGLFPLFEESGLTFMSTLKGNK